MALMEASSMSPLPTPPPTPPLSPSHIPLPKDYAEFKLSLHSLLAHTMIHRPGKVLEDLACRKIQFLHPFISLSLSLSLSLSYSLTYSLTCFYRSDHCLVRDLKVACIEFADFFCHQLENMHRYDILAHIKYSAKLALL